MADYQITCVTMSYSGREHEHITHVGNGKQWYDTVKNVIGFIKSGQHTFYVRDSYGRRANVGVVEPAGRPAYLRTYADGYYTDNLLALNSCPA